MERQSKREEIEEEKNGDESPSPNPNPGPEPLKRAKSVTTKVPEVEIHLFRQGKGPIDVFKSSLGGWDQDRLEVQDILDKHGFKSVFAFNAQSGRSVGIRFNPKNGRSLLPYKDGSVIYIDGEPKNALYLIYLATDGLIGNARVVEDSMFQPITKILVGVAVITAFIMLVMKETPGWLKGSTIIDNCPPWVLACVVIVFTRMRKRTRDVLKKFGW
ncbi:hypothetical protein Syun_004866 [Stephania yunnanensis]|uniref:Uncharacterized protein n=1 Tax=Stephania yunnanensis TaxID=152371 RepID=A0AAP0L7Y1_9MAGN